MKTVTGLGGDRRGCNLSAQLPKLITYLSYELAAVQNQDNGRSISKAEGRLRAHFCPSLLPRRMNGQRIPSPRHGSSTALWGFTDLIIVFHRTGRP
jgi:hypothetical protein